MAARAHRVVIVGGGFGGLFATKFLRKGDVEITLVDRTNHHLFQPLLYQVATGILSVGDVAPPLRGILRKHKNVDVELAEVTGFDLENRKVLAARPGGAEIAFRYDSLIVAAGSTTSYFGHDELAEHSLPDEDDRRRAQPAAADLRGVRDGRVGAFGGRARRWLTFAVVGGGPTGCEIAGQIAELARRTLKEDFRSIDPTSAAVLLFDAATRSRDLRRPAVRKGDRARAPRGRDPQRKRASRGHGGRHRRQSSRGEERIACHTVVWAAGVEASPLGRILAEAAGAECDRAGRRRRSRLHAPGPPRGVRHRRRDGARRPPGRRRGRAAAGDLRRADDQAAARWHDGEHAVQVPRSREHGGDRPRPRGGELPRPALRRGPRFPHLALRPPGVAHRFPEPGCGPGCVDLGLHRPLAQPAAFTVESVGGSDIYRGFAR